MATNNKILAKKLNKAKLLYQKKKLIDAINGCDGCQECRDSWDSLAEVDRLLSLCNKK